ncbi:hypothetical protein [Tenacibaculum sp. nBUS_03]|uniref:hypothetical protein n=1 Tax=Tenacibaculum sp. nBUS_03 TaxID=3395320 RepID=UPI003EB74D70
MKILIQSDIDDNLELIQEFNDYEIEKQEADIGSGADWWFTLLTIGGIAGTIFLSGKKIEENIEAWIKIGTRIKNVLKKKKKINVFLDKDGATALAIKEISDKTEKLKSIELIFDKKLSNGGLEKVYNDGRKAGDLISEPYNFYILIFKVNENDQYIFCIKSNGEIKYKDIFSDAWFDYNYDWNTIENRTDYYS